MGGKGRRRREKNYRASHGGYTGLPPPPDPSKLDALPSKLRKIISFTQSQQHRHSGADDGLSKDVEIRKKKDHRHAQNHKGEAGRLDVKEADAVVQLKAPQHNDSDDEQLMQHSANEKKKRKRKRKEVKDLRFAIEVDKTSSQLKRRERKKKYLEAKKKKHRKVSAEEKLDFPGREKIKFGDIVQAPPKLAVTPKAFKNVQDASQERLRLRAIEEYRSRKGWTSRPGSHLPLPVTSSNP